METVTVPALLSVAVSSLTGAVVFLFLEVKKAYKDRDAARLQCETEMKALHENHKAEIRQIHEAHKADNREAAKTLIAVTERTVTAVERLCDLEERRRP